MNTFLIFAIWLGTCTVALALNAPTDIDLKAAYCVKMNQLIIADAKPAGSLQEKIDNDARDRLHRLQSYLLPRLNYLDATGLLAASKRAEIDWPKWSRLADSCTRQSDMESATFSEKYSLCVKGELSDRLDSCQNLNWLPF